VAARDLLVLVTFEHRADLGLDDLGQVEVGQVRRLLDRLDDRVVADALAVGRHRLSRTVAPSPSPEMNSSTRRDLPTPADPNRVKS